MAGGCLSLATFYRNFMTAMCCGAVIEIIYVDGIIYSKLGMLQDAISKQSSRRH